MSISVYRELEHIFPQHIAWKIMRMLIRIKFEKYNFYISTKPRTFLEFEQYLKNKKQSIYKIILDANVGMRRDKMYVKICTVIQSQPSVIHLSLRPAELTFDRNISVVPFRILVGGYDASDIIRKEQSKILRPKITRREKLRQARSIWRR